MFESLVVPAAGSSQALTLHYWPCRGVRRLRQPLVLLHGWGSDSQTWSELAPLLARDFDLIAVDLPGFGESPAVDRDTDPGFYRDSVLQLLRQQLPEKMVLMGWSLGGMLATAFAGRFPDRVSHLVTLAANASFVQKAGWPAAMTEELFSGFLASFCRDSSLCLQRFTRLQVQGEAEARRLQKCLRKLQPPVEADSWGAALGLLAVIDNRATIRQLPMPTLFLLAEQDALVPVAAAERMRALRPADACNRVEILPAVAHAAHLSKPALVQERICDFLCFDPYALAKQQVASAFGRAAKTYDSVAHLQRMVGQQLLERLTAPGHLSVKNPIVKSPFGKNAAKGCVQETGKRPVQSPARIADLGCGTGFITSRLQKKYPEAGCIGLDLSEGMLRYCQSRASDSNIQSSATGSAANAYGNCNWVCSDAEQLPFADGSLDLVFSNFTFQWCHQLEKLFAELRRVLKPGGQLAFSTIGPASLRELRHAWKTVDGFTHVNRFAPFSEVREHLLGQSFHIDIFDESEQIQYYPALTDLTRELKALGAHNINAGRNGNLTGRGRLLQFRQAYEQFRTPGGLPASWQILQVIAIRK